MSVFNHHDLSLLHPSFDSPLVDAVTDLEHLRRLHLQGTTPPEVFFQLKHIFHILECLGSARIEGNHTTLADYVESTLDDSPQAHSEPIMETDNIEKAMRYIDERIHSGGELTEMFIRDLHTITVTTLKREGDATPGAYRQTQVSIAQSEHLPPEFILVPQYMQELVAFINHDDPPKYALIKAALAHHRFGWIHPFGNGNGRVARLLTYALLIQYGFNVKTGGRLLNPTAVFCNDRDKYYTMLAQADTGTPAGCEAWCVVHLRPARLTDRIAQGRSINRLRLFEKQNIDTRTGLRQRKKADYPNRNGHPAHRSSSGYRQGN